MVLRENSINKFFVSLNTITGNLDCTDNSPDPVYQGPAPNNTVGGVATGECVGLVAP